MKKVFLFIFLVLISYQAKAGLAVTCSSGMDSSKVDSPYYVNIAVGAPIEVNLVMNKTYFFSWSTREAALKECNRIASGWVVIKCQFSNKDACAENTITNEKITFSPIIPSLQNIQYQYVYGPKSLNDAVYLATQSKIQLAAYNAYKAKNGNLIFQCKNLAPTTTSYQGGQYGGGGSVTTYTFNIYGLGKNALWYVVDTVTYIESTYDNIRDIVELAQEKCDEVFNTDWSKGIDINSSSFSQQMNEAAQKIKALFPEKA